MVKKGFAHNSKHKETDTYPPMKHLDLKSLNFNEFQHKLVGRDSKIAVSNCNDTKPVPTFMKSNNLEFDLIRHH